MIAFCLQLLVKVCLQLVHGSSLASNEPFPIAILVLLIASKGACGCYTSIVSFGDSLTDTGNLLHLSPPANPPLSGRPPYGETFFHHPTGRFSDGRLVVDFIAESLGLPLLRPFIGDRTAEASSRDFRRGVNFAVGGATALDHSSLRKYGIVNPATNASLASQLGWFKEFFATICKIDPTDCKRFLKTSLILVGEIGGNEYNYALAQGVDMEVIKSSIVAEVVSEISFTLQELIKLGATTLMVPGNLPIGCLPCHLAYYNNTDENEYDSKTGCLNWLNEFSEYHNELLQLELNRIRGLNPYVNIIYGDYYNAAMLIYRSPNNFGFTNSIKACCGGGGSYNYIESALCSSPLATRCDDPSKYVSWDGLHFTEAGYHWIARALLDGPYTIPPIRRNCTSISKVSSYR